MPTGREALHALDTSCSCAVSTTAAIKGFSPAAVTSMCLCRSLIPMGLGRVATCPLGPAVFFVSDSQRLARSLFSSSIQATTKYSRIPLVFPLQCLRGTARTSDRQFVCAFHARYKPPLRELVGLSSRGVTQVEMGDKTLATTTEKKIRRRPSTPATNADQPPTSF